MAQRADQMAFPDARWPEQQNVGAPVNPLGAFGERHDLRLGHTGYSGKVKAGEPLVWTQARFIAVAVDAPRLTRIDFMLQQGFQ